MAWGAFQEKEDDGLEYITCTFTFDSINLATGLNVILKGQNPLILKTRNHGNISLGTTLSADGGDSDSNYGSFFEAVPFGIGKLGGANGGLKNSTGGFGAGGGKLSVDGTVGGGRRLRLRWPISFDRHYLWCDLWGSFPPSHLHGGSGGGATTGVDLTNPSQTIVGLPTNVTGNEGVAKAIDNNTGTKYLHNDDENNPGLVVTTTGGIVSGISLTSANDVPDRDPASYELHGSNDAGTTYTLISGGPVPTFSARHQERKIFFNNNSAYNTYKLIFPSIVNASADRMQIAEIELLESTGGGAGGGAISLEADGNGTLTILSGAVISANGGSVGNTATSGGGGSGGSIRLAGKTITNNGTIRAKGATPPAGGTGGGGRIAFNYSTNLTQGTYDVGSGGQQGTVTFNTLPW